MHLLIRKNWKNILVQCKEEGKLLEARYQCKLARLPRWIQRYTVSMHP